MNAYEWAAAAAASAPFVYWGLSAVFSRVDGWCDQRVRDMVEAALADLEQDDTQLVAPVVDSSVDDVMVIADAVGVSAAEALVDWHTQPAALSDARVEEVLASWSRAAAVVGDDPFLVGGPGAVGEDGLATGLPAGAYDDPACDTCGGTGLIEVEGKAWSPYIRCWDCDGTGDAA